MMPASMITSRDATEQLRRKVRYDNDDDDDDGITFSAQPESVRV